MSAKKIAIVTGGNKGIGYAIVKGLCEKYAGKVYLTSRDINRGKEAVAKLNKLGFQPSYHQLDIDDQASVDKFKEYISDNYGGVDILINNAATAFKVDAPEPFHIQAEITINTNYYSALRVSEAFIPLLRKNGRLVNISSSLGHLSRIASPQLQVKFVDPKLTVPQLSELMNQFVKDAKTQSKEYIENTWGKMGTYAVSKVGLSVLTKLQQELVDNERPGKNILVNCCHPGYVDTDMTSHKGPLTIEEGAVAPLYLALEPHGLKGQFVWKDCSVVHFIIPNFPTPF